MFSLSVFFILIGIKRKLFERHMENLALYIFLLYRVTSTANIYGVVMIFCIVQFIGRQ
jgi:hypothetical protein